MHRDTAPLKKRKYNTIKESGIKKINIQTKEEETKVFSHINSCII